MDEPYVITGDMIISAMASAISPLVGTKLQAIYKNTPMQNARTPYVFLSSIGTSITPEMKGWFMFRYSVDVICHPELNSTKAESWFRDITLNLSEVLNYIDVGNEKCKCERQFSRVVDGILHIICNYHTRAYIPDGDVKNLMQILKDREFVKTN